MKLDRNINPDGRGKYALINRRKLQEIDQREIDGKAGQQQFLTLPGWAIEDGSDGDFFVLKLKDQFATAALWGYVSAVRKEADRVREADSEKATSLYEYADEVAKLAKVAASVGCKIPD